MTRRRKLYRSEEITSTSGNVPVWSDSFKFSTQWTAENREARMSAILDNLRNKVRKDTMLNIKGHWIKGHDDGDGFIRYLDSLDASFASERKDYYARGQEHIEPKDRTLTEGQPTDWFREMKHRNLMMKMIAGRGVTDKPFEWVLEKLACLA